MRIATCFALLFSCVALADAPRGQGIVDALYERVVHASPETRGALEAELDRACAQKDCVASRLFWTTDLEEAKAAARHLHRPILALHLLGRLDEELSCANSRFFRTLLYSDASINTILRDRYVLYWHSVRPVPHVTIDMGDGRVIRQTITGNSVHYLLDADGNVFDALPGLYSPRAFRQQLETWLQLHEAMEGASAAQRRQLLSTFHAVDASGGAPATIAARPTAVDASRLVVTKTAVEAPMLRQLERPVGIQIAQVQPLPEWMRIGEAKKDEVEFSATAIELITRKQFGAGPVDANALRLLLDALRRSVAADTAFNEATMRPRIHSWFSNGDVADLSSLDERVYRELFLTPKDDPWLGLQPPTVFNAIER